MKKLLFILPLLLLLLLASCTREVEPFAPIAYDYSPMDSGKFIVYQVDSIIYNEYEDRVDSHSYEIRYEYGRTELDAADEPIYRLLRYERTAANATWELKAVFAAKNTRNQFQLIENNQRLIKLTYPIAEGGDWDGLPFIRRDTSIEIQGGSINLYKDWDNFSYQAIEPNFSINGLSFDTTVVVLQVDKTNNIERRYAKERYAKGVGLIEREMWILDTQCGGNIATCISTPWEIKAEKGFILRQRVLQHNF
jgi:hypothetical protein